MGNSETLAHGVHHGRCDRERFIEMKDRRKAFTVFMACLGGILTGAKAIVRTTSLFVMGLIGLLAEAAITSEDDADSEGGDLTGDYNFRTRKFDNGTDPYGWYEDDL